MAHNTFDSIKIGIASPEQILSWSHGEVTKPETINYRTLKPERDGLFCEKIFGPTKDWECNCGKLNKNRHKGQICDKCGVESTRAKVRRERMGHIALAAPVSHIWYLKAVPSRIGLILDVTPKSLEKVIYFSSYIVTDKGFTPLEDKQLLTELEYNDMLDRYGEDSFKASMGAEAIKELLEKIDLDELSKELSRDLETATGQKRIKLYKRFEVCESFRASGNRPEWMIMDVVPVIPPDIRPMVQLDGGRFATSDLNDLYRRVINRNNRLLKLLELSAPDIIVRNEKRMLQEAVDSLIDNGRRGRAVTGGTSNRPLKSLSDMLKGKQGRFRQNLLGKRVDYSGRSVIVVGPELKMYQCGLPKEMALELFKPFVMRELVDKNYATNIKSAKKVVEKAKSEVWDALETVIKGHPVLLNRAPTLHRLGIQAFEPILVEGKAIKLHPLVCSAYNADFDGDQMAVHVPLSKEAQNEAKTLMLASGNLLKLSDGSPVAVPSQDMVLGSYYLTIVNDPKVDEDGNEVPCMVFRDEDEALMAYSTGAISLHDMVRIRRTGEFQGEQITQIIKTTVGRLIFNTPIPQDLGYVDRSKKENALVMEIDFLVGKKQLGSLIKNCIETHGTKTTSVVLDAIKSLGFKYSTKGAITVAACDAVIPPKKKQLLQEAEDKVTQTRKMYEKGLLSDDQRYQSVTKIWNETTDLVSKALQENMDARNPIWMMADSGARGSMNQIKQLAGMRGLIASTTGKTIEIPIKSNYREGLNILEYFISARGARKGLADTALRTADSGYLTRRLVDVSHDVIVRQHDCGAKHGIFVKEIRDGGSVIEPLADRLLGRYTVNDLIHPTTGELVVSKNEMMDTAAIDRIEKAFGVYDEVSNSYDVSDVEIEIRSVLNCKAPVGTCSVCYGASLADGKTVPLGEVVGTIAAQSIGEPGTQLTMRTFHTGGIASAEDITQGLPRVEELFESRRPKKIAIMTEIAGKVRIDETRKGTYAVICGIDANGANGALEERSYLIPFDQRLVPTVFDGADVQKGDYLTEGSAAPADILAIKGRTAVQDYIIQEVQRVYRQQGVEINDKHIEVIVRQMMKKVRVNESGSTDMIGGTMVDYKEYREKNDEIVEKIKEGDTTLSTPDVTDVILGITKAALATESFLSAASFQETTKILTDAAIRGKVDPLLGLKENVIIGKLIPAGASVAKVEEEEEIQPEILEEYQNI